MSTPSISRRSNSSFFKKKTLSSPYDVDRAIETDAFSSPKWRLERFRFRVRRARLRLWKMAVSAGASGWSGRRLACASLRSFFGLFLLLGLAPRPGAATTHWVVTEDGKIQQQVRGRGFQVDAKKVPVKTFLPSSRSSRAGGKSRGLRGLLG